MPLTLLKPLDEITAHDIALALDPLPARPRPASMQRPPDPAIQSAQWDLLTPQERNLLTEFLDKLKKNQPVRIHVSHKLATAILVGLNWRNYRHLRMPRALYYAQEMKAGNWSETSQGMSLSEDKNRLTNGQHRLIGQELSKTSQTYDFKLITPAAELNEDGALTRSLADLTRLEAKIASSARTMNEHVKNYTGPASSAVVVKIVNEYRPSIDLVYGYKQFKKSTATIGTFAYCHGQLETWPTLQRKLEDFIKSVADGLMLKESDPAYELREWLLKTGHSTVGERREVRNRIIKACYVQLTKHKNATIDEVEKWFRGRNENKLKVFSGYMELEANLA